MSKGMRTCSVCGRDFALLVEDHYISRAEGKSGIVAIVGGDEPKLHDAIDCPHCGCQQLLQGRERAMYHEEIILEEEDEEEEEDVG